MLLCSCLWSFTPCCSWPELDALVLLLCAACDSPLLALNAFYCYSVLAGFSVAVCWSAEIVSVALKLIVGKSWRTFALRLSWNLWMIAQPKWLRFSFMTLACSWVDLKLVWIRIAVVTEDSYNILFRLLNGGGYLRLLLLCSWYLFCGWLKDCLVKNRGGHSRLLQYLVSTVEWWWSLKTPTALLVLVLRLIERLFD